MPCSEFLSHCSRVPFGCRSTPHLSSKLYVTITSLHPKCIDLITLAYDLPPTIPPVTSDQSPSSRTRDRETRRKSFTFRSNHTNKTVKNVLEKIKRNREAMGRMNIPPTLIRHKLPPTLYKTEYPRGRVIVI